MWTKTLILLSALTLSACDPVTTQLLVPQVPEELRTICAESERDATTTRQLAIYATEQTGALRCANSKIVAIDAILDDADAKAAGAR